MNTQYMNSPHRYKRRHAQFKKVINQLESIIFSKRNLKKIYRDQDRLNQFKMKKHLIQQLNNDIQQIVEAMQTANSKLSTQRLERLVNISNPVADLTKTRNEELKSMTTAAYLEELELETLNPDDKVTNGTTIVLDRTNETIIASDMPLQKSSCPDSNMSVVDKVSHLQNSSVTPDLEVKILGDVIDELIDKSIEDMREELVVKL